MTLSGPFLTCNFRHISPKMSHPKAREWIVSAARANYQELSKLANDHPMLVRLQVSPESHVLVTLFLGHLSELD